MPRIRRLTSDTICLFAAAFLAVTASTTGQAASRKHDAQRIVLSDHADGRHDRAPCPLQTVTPG
ncbi:MAG TPA: hypothetical protein VH414_16910 [Lichenihabitans sp.]|jgi:hypothetical protein|nr:hypothetical protein [Lichenihabitans sp.]